MILESQIVSSAEYEMFITVGGTQIQMNTGVSLSIDNTQDVTEVFAIGQMTPIGTKKLNRRFSGSVSIQEGEYELILDAINATLSNGFIASIVDLSSFSLSWSVHMSGLTTPRTIMYSLDNCKITSNGVSVDRNSVETNTSFSIVATGMTRKVING